jgi:hypothetical protein
MGYGVGGGDVLTLYLSDIDLEPGHVEPALQLEGKCGHERKRRRKREARADGYTVVALVTLYRNLGCAPGYVAVDLFVEHLAVLSADFGRLAGWNDEVETRQCAGRVSGGTGSKVCAVNLHVGCPAVTDPNPYA